MSKVKTALAYLFFLSIATHPICSYSAFHILDSLSFSLPKIPTPCIYIEDLKIAPLVEEKSSLSGPCMITILSSPSCFMKTWGPTYKYANNFKNALLSGFYNNHPHLLYCIFDHDFNIRGYIMTKLLGKPFDLKKERDHYNNHAIAPAEVQIEEYKEVLNFLIDCFKKTHLIYLDLAPRNLMFDNDGKLVLTDLELIFHPNEYFHPKTGGLVKRFYKRLPPEYKEVIEEQFPLLQKGR